MKGSLQEKGGKYYAVFRINGKQKWVNTGIEVKKGNKRKAEAKMTEILVQYNSNPNIVDKMPFTDYINLWLKQVKNKVDTVTYEGYMQYARKHIIPYFEPLKLDLKDVKMSHIESYYNYKSVSGRLDGKNGGLSYRTIKLHSVVLNLVFKYAMRNKLIKENPCTYAEIPQNAHRSEKKTDFYTAEQCQALLKLIKGTPLYDMVYITFMYGLRRSELLGLKWSAVDFENNTLSVCHTVVLQHVVVAKDKTKNQTSKRIYPLLDDVRKILLRLKAEQEEHRSLFGNCYIDTDYIFVKENGEQYYPSYPTHTLKKVLKKYGLPHIRWHDLRHSCASMLILKGWNMKDISEWLGHADIGTTMNIYGHIGMGHKRDLGNTLIGTL
ncbi:MAG: site-specific integrase [Firmicutes bacterium]|nr:site-specific integrase [Bacillota bacterium]